VRADGSTNPLLKDGGLSTVVGKGDSNGALSTQLTRLQNRGSNPDRCARPDTLCFAVVDFHSVAGPRPAHLLTTLSMRLC
jgi:hypothetical protein